MSSVRIRHKGRTTYLKVDPSLFVLSRTAKSGQNQLLAGLAQSWLELLSDSPLLSRPRRVYVKFLSELYADTRDIVIQYSDLSHKLVSQTSLTGGGTLIGEWIDEFKDTPVFYEYHQWFTTGNPIVLKYLYSFLNFGKKLEFEDEDFKLVAFRDWLGIEKELSDQVFVEDDLNSMSIILNKILSPLSSEEFWPKHGPGSVSERGIRSPIHKHNLMSYDRILDHVFFTGPYNSFGLREDDGYSVERVLPDPDYWKPERIVKRRVARLMFVPKSLKTARSVCMEPAILMYFQQALADQATRVINKTPFGRFIRLDDQTRNQDLSLIGSYTGEIDTIDLSAASDRLSVRLVKRIFPRNWLIPMLATRSSRVELPDGSTKVIEKFAPMGSAMCFPTQCIVFAAVCIYAAHLWRCGSATLSSETLSPFDVHLSLSLFRDKYDGYHPRDKRLHPLAVYGDDICCDYRITPYVMAILGRLGFSVNINKSFRGAQAFRESCGLFALNGHDVSPLYYRVKGNEAKLSASFISSQISLANEAWRLGYRNLYRSCVRRLMKGGKPIPFIRDTSGNFGIFCSNPKNSHLRSRENPDLQRVEYRALTIASKDKHRGDYRHENYLYMRWKAIGGSEDEILDPRSHDYSHGHTMKRSWTPLY